jgi:hypothetical protein
MTRDTARCSWQFSYFFYRGYLTGAPGAGARM